MSNLYKPHLYSITSSLHNAEELEKSFHTFIKNIEAEGKFLFDNHDISFDNYDPQQLNIIFIQTGGTENQFKELLKTISGPFYLLAQDTNNSLAASIEILTYLRQHHQDGEIISGGIKDIAIRIKELITIKQAKLKLNGARLGIIGEPSDWLIASCVNAQDLSNKFGINLIKIDISELIVEITKNVSINLPIDINQNYDQATLSKACHIYMAIRNLITKYQLQAVTIRCFDLLGPVKNTSCLALAILNSEGFVATCEGDIPSTVSMMILNALTGCPGFQANPSTLNKSDQTMIFAHCTVPLKMVTSYSYDTHFESNLGIGIVGKLALGDATIFKLGASLDDYSVFDTTIIPHNTIPQLCRTQVKLKLDNLAMNYFLTNPLGNHHIIINGQYKSLIISFFKQFFM